MQKLATPFTKNIAKWVTKNFGKNGYQITPELFFHFPNFNNKKGYMYGEHLTTVKEIMQNYTVVSEEYFLENAFKISELIGYRLNGKITATQASIMLGCLPTNNADNCFMSANSLLVPRAKELGILETCFEEVDKEVVMPLKQTFTRDEVIILCTNAFKANESIYNSNKKEVVIVTEWIKNNLK